MDKLNFAISDEILKNYPDLHIGVLVAKGIDNKDKGEELEEFKQRKLQEFLRKYSLEDIKNHPYIQVWRQTYKSFGTNPKKKTPTAEAFLTRVIKTGRLPRINPVVDLYLLVELDFFLPIGGYDLDKVEGEIKLRYSKGGEKFVPLGSEITEETYPGEIVYADQGKVLTRRWNYKDTELAKITPSSKNIILMSEAPTTDIPTPHLEKLLTTLKSYIQNFCGGEIETEILNNSTWRSF